MKKINKKIILILIIFSVGFLYLLSGKVEASEVKRITMPKEFFETLVSPEINTNVRLECNIEINDTECNFNVGSDTIFDLNGHTITVNKNTANEHGIIVSFKNDNCKLTITDTSEGGKITSKNTIDSLLYITNTDENAEHTSCQVVIKNGIFEGPSNKNAMINTKLNSHIGLIVENGTFITNYHLASVFSTGFDMHFKEMSVKSECATGEFCVTTDRTEINEIIDENSDIWLDGVRKYTDNPETEIGSIYCDCQSKTGIEIKPKDTSIIEPYVVNNIDEFECAIQTAEVRTIQLNRDIITEENIDIIINGNEKIIDLNGLGIKLEGDNRINIIYKTPHNFILKDDSREKEGYIDATKSDVADRAIIHPENNSNKDVQMIINGGAIDCSTKRVFEDTDKFQLIINKGDFSSYGSLFEFDHSETKISIKRLTLSNCNKGDKSIAFTEGKYFSIEPLSKIINSESKLICTGRGDSFYNEYPNTIECGRVFLGEVSLTIMPIKGLVIDKIVFDPQEYGYPKNQDSSKSIVITNNSERDIEIDDIRLDGEIDDFFMNIDRDLPIIPAGRRVTIEGSTIRPEEGLEIGKHEVMIYITTTDGDIYRGEVEFEVTKIKPTLSLNISDWTYDELGENAIAPTYSNNVELSENELAEGKQIQDIEKIEYAVKQEESNAQQVFSSDVPIHAGKYIVKYTTEETALYLGNSETKEFEITRKEIPLPQIKVSRYEENYTYKGETYKPEVTVKIADSDITLANGEDYTVEYGDNINAGKGTIKIKSAPISNYIFDDKNIEFNISPKDILESDVQVPTELGYENGNPLTPTVKVNVDGKELVKDTDYTVIYEGQKGEIGEKIKVIIQGKENGNYSGTVEKYVNIIEKKNQELSFAQKEITKKYTDSKFTIKPTHNVGNGKITYKSEDSKVIKVNETTGEVTIVGVGETEIKATASETEIYKETTVSYKVKVNKADYDTSKIKFENLTVAFDGKPHSIIATGLPAGVKVTFTNNGKTEVGKHQVTASFTGDYAHYNSIPNKTVTLTITNKSIANAIVSGIEDKTYTGKKIKQSLSIKDGNITLNEGTDYTVDYNNSNKKIGIATIKITGKGNYAGTITRTFKIIPKGTSIKKLKAGKKQFKATWKKQKNQTSGYEIQYSTKKNFKSAKKVKIKKNKTTSSTVKKLKAKKKYYVRIRTYKTVNGKKFYSDWSKVKSVKTKK